MRDHGHDWSKDCEKCSRCAMARSGSHTWHGCKCSKCGETRDHGHDWTKGEKCSICSKTNQLFDAAQSGDLARVKALLEGDPDLAFSEDKKGRSPSHWAAAEGHKDVVELLLAYKVSISLHDASAVGALDQVKELLEGDPGLVFSRDHTGSTPLHFAAYDHRDVVEFLLANKAEVNSKNNDHETPLHLAAMRGRKDIVGLLLANEAAVDARNFSGRTPLHLAAARGHTDVAELLLANNANVNARWDFGEGTPLHAAVANGHKDTAELLLANGADVNANSNGGETPLHTAAEKGQKDLAELLLASGGDVNARGGWRSETPLHTAADKGHKDLVELLVVNRASVNARSRTGRTPLFFAALGGYKDVTDLLLANHAEVNAKTNHGWTPLHAAAYKGHKDLVELLLAHGAEVNDTVGEPPLHLARIHKDVAELLLAFGANPLPTFDHKLDGALFDAVESNDRERVTALIYAGANVNALDWSGVFSKTPLKSAAFCDHSDLVRLLISAGARTEMRDDRGRTPLHWATIRNHVAAVKALIGGGADVNAMTGFECEGALGWHTPLHFAAENQNAEIVRALLESGADRHAVDVDKHIPLNYAGNSDVVLLLGGTEVLASRISGAQEDVEAMRDALNSSLRIGPFLEKVEAMGFRYPVTSNKRGDVMTGPTGNLLIHFTGGKAWEPEANAWTIVFTDAVTNTDTTLVSDGKLVPGPPRVTKA